METEAFKGNIGIGPANPITAKKSLTEHLDDFQASIGKGHTTRHARLATRCLRRMAEALYPSISTDYGIPP